DAISVLHHRRRERLVPRAPRWIRRREQGAKPRGPLARAEPVEAVEAAAGEILARDVERPPYGLPATDRDDLGARRERVEPLRRRGEAGTDDGDRRSVVVLLVRMHRARVAAQLVGHVQPRMAGRDEHVPEPAVAVELEAAVDGADALDAGSAKAALPAAAVAQPLDVREKLVHRGMKAVAERPEQRSHRAAAHGGAEREAGKRRRQAVAVALGSHLPLPDRGGAAAERRGGVVVGAEHRDLLGRELAPQRLVRREPGQPGAHDRDTHYFTEPASSPWTK